MADRVVLSVQASQDQHNSVTFFALNCMFTLSGACQCLLKNDVFTNHHWQITTFFSILSLLIVLDVIPMLQCSFQTIIFAKHTQKPRIIFALCLAVRILWRWTVNSKLIRIPSADSTNQPTWRSCLSLHRLLKDPVMKQIIDVNKMVTYI